jgi:hypothetical protein
MYWREQGSMYWTLQIEIPWIELTRFLIRYMSERHVYFYITFLSDCQTVKVLNAVLTYQCRSTKVQHQVQHLWIPPWIIPNSKSCGRGSWRVTDPVFLLLVGLPALLIPEDVLPLLLQVFRGGQTLVQASVAGVQEQLPLLQLLTGVGSTQHGMSGRGTLLGWYLCLGRSM